MPTHFYIAIYIINALWLAWALLWAISALFTKRTTYKQPLRQRLAFMVWITPAIVLMQPLPGLRFRLIPESLALPIEIAGITLCAAGLAFSVWARFHLGRNWSGFVTLKENHQLITTGPYAVVRHPIYTGILTAITGTILALTPSIGGIISLPFVTIAFITKLRQEESLMLQQFPEAYPAYKSQVHAALIPFLL